MTYSSDSTAINALKNGDGKAFEWIYKKYLNLLCFYAAKIVRDMETGKDIVQDVFEKLWKEREKISIIDSLQAFLHTCVRNKCRDYLDHIKFKDEYNQKIINNSDTLSIHKDDDPSLILVAKETELIINNAINILPKQCKSIFILWWEAGLKYDQIVERLGISIGTVKAQINRAKSKLRKTLENYG